MRTQKRVDLHKAHPGQVFYKNKNTQTQARRREGSFHERVPLLGVPLLRGRSGRSWKGPIILFIAK